MQADQHLNHYRIVAALGEGGMGQVYRAEDTRLRRHVAIKVLPAELAADPERLARLEREAQLLAQLEHPNVAAVYGLEEAAGTRFLVMQLVEGETLADRVAVGPLPVGEAIAVARQVAEGLEAAHERGIIHRDLKPANVMVSADGAVKVLDFGLAKALGSEAREPSTELTASPTVLAATSAGVIMGTAGYMSPEQARGKAVDKRSDIWSFGCVLYEMLAGRRLFDGETVTDVIAAVVTRDIDWSALPPGVPPHVRKLLRRCLTRDPRERLRDMGEARIALSPGEGDAAESRAATAAAAPWRTPVAFVTGALLTAVAVWLGAGGSASSTDARTYRVVVPAPDWANAGYSWGLYLSPDGRTLGYHDRNDWSLRLRSLDGWDSRVVAGTAWSRDGFFSPDGRWFAYRNQSADTIEKVLIDGGTPVVLATEVGVFNSGVWGSSGLYVSASIGARAGIWRIREDGTGIELIKDREESRISWFLDLLPEENALLYTSGTIADAGSADIDYYEERIEALLLADNSSRPVIEGGRQSRYLEPGYLVMVTGDNSLSVVPFDKKSLAVTGTLRRVVDAVRFDNNFNARYTVSPDGTLAYVEPVPRSGTGRLVRMSPQGVVSYGTEVDLGPWHRGERLNVSPDGTTVAVFLNRGQESSLGLVDAQRGTWAPLLSDGGAPVLEAVWSPAGDRIAFGRGGTSGFYSSQLWVTDATGSGTARRLPIEEGLAVRSVGGWLDLGNWSADGTRVAIEFQDVTSNSDIWVVPVAEDEHPEQWLTSPANERLPRFSPDGSWIAYVSDAAGQFQAYVQAYPGPGRSVALSRAAADRVVWRPDGRALYLLQGRTLTEVSFAPGSPARIGAERVVGELPEGVTHGLDVDPTTGDLVMVERPQVPESDEVRVIVNWATELARQSRGEQ